jgi:hypothetical protein
MIDLNGQGHYLNWGWIQLSWANTIVILLMLAVFWLAVALPFPGSAGSAADREPDRATDPEDLP